MKQPEKMVTSNFLKFEKIVLKEITIEILTKLVYLIW